MDDTLNPTLAARDRRMAPSVPQAGLSADTHGDVPGMLKFGVVVGLSLLIFFPRFQINIGPVFVNVGLIAQYLVIGILLAKGTLRVDPMRAALFGIGMLIMFMGWILSSGKASYLSAMLLAASYLAFIFIARMPDGNEALQRFVMATFSNLMLVAGAAGIAQFFIQFAYKPLWLFDFTNYIPLIIRGTGTYNTIIPVGSFFKSNGFFFREPSTCSQYVALALICEISLMRRKLRKFSPIRMGTFGLALLVTYSGTGLATLFIGLMFPLGLKTAIRMGMLGVGGLLIFVVLGTSLNLDFTANRINEFNTPGTSAYARFVAPVNFISNKMDSHSISFLVGNGPGSVTRNAEHTSGYENADPTWAKALYEEGVIGFVIFVALVFYSTFRSRAPAELIGALCAGWLIIWGGVFLAPEITALIFIMCAVSATKNRPQNRQRTRLVADVGRLSMPAQRR